MKVYINIYRKKYIRKFALSYLDQKKDRYQTFLNTVINPVS